MRLAVRDDHRADYQVVDGGRRDRRRGGRRGRVLRACLCSGAGARRDGLDRPFGAADGGRADLRQLDGAARRGAPRGAGSGAGRWLLSLGIAAALAANVAHGLGHGPAGAAVAAWPAVALVGSYELFMTIIRGTRQPDGGVSETEHVSVAVSGADPLRVRAAEVFAAEVAAGRVPSVRAIRSRLRVGQPRAQQVRAYLDALADG